MDTETDGCGVSTNIHNNTNRGCNTSNITKARNKPNHVMERGTNTTMDAKTTKCDNTQSYSTQERPGTNTTTTTDTPTEKETDTRDYERRRRESTNSGSSSDNGTTTDDEQTTENRDRKTYFTFILHKENQSTGWQTANRHKPSPTFIAFDHGTHYHILYASDERGGNVARQRNRIAIYMGATPAGSTEVNATHSKVQFLRRFIQYCIRNGIETANKYGIRINTEMKEAYDIFQDLYHNRDPNDINKEIQKCKKYIEDAKEYSRIGTQKRKNVVDTIMDLLVQYINNNTDWNIIDKTIKHQLMREYGLSVDNYVQRLIRTRKHENMKYYKYAPLTELLIKELENYKANIKEAKPDFHQ